MTITNKNVLKLLFAKMSRSILKLYVYYNLAIQRIMSVVILSDNNLNEIFIVTLV